MEIQRANHLLIMGCGDFSPPNALETNTNVKTAGVAGSEKPRSLPLSQCSTRPTIKYKAKYRKLLQKELRRREFFAYCKRSAASASYRAKKIGVPCDIDAHFLDELLVDQKYRCAVSGILFSLPPKGLTGLPQDPFGPSLDRRIPADGYVRSNVRLTCCIVNMAMNQWGIEALFKMVDAINVQRRA